MQNSRSLIPALFSAKMKVKLAAKEQFYLVHLAFRPPVTHVRHIKTSFRCRRQSNESKSVAFRFIIIGAMDGVRVRKEEK